MLCSPALINMPKGVCFIDDDDDNDDNSNSDSLLTGTPRYSVLIDKPAIFVVVVHNYSLIDEDGGKIQSWGICLPHSNAPNNAKRQAK